MGRKRSGRRSGRVMHLAPVIGAGMTGVILLTDGGSYSPLKAMQEGRWSDAGRYIVANAKKVTTWTPLVVGGVVHIGSKILHVNIPLSKNVKVA